MNEAPRSNQESHVLFEHEFKKEPWVIYIRLCTESVADQTDHFTDAFVRENVAHVVTT